MIKYDNWEITGKIDKKKVVKYFSTIKKYLLSKGKEFECLIKGKVKIVKKIPNQPSNIGGYCYKSGLIAITEEVVEKKEYDLFLHELGHLFWGYLYASQKNIFERKYNQLIKKARKEAKKTKFNRRDILIIRDGKWKGKIEVIYYKNNTLKFIRRAR